MKTASIAAAIVLVPILVVGTAISSAQAFDPLALGALGTAMGFAVGGSARDAAIGGAAGVAAGMLLNAPRYYGPGYAYGYYDPPPPRYRAPCVWIPGHYSYSGYWVSGYCSSRVWIPGRYNRYGDWVPGHWSYR